MLVYFDESYNNKYLIYACLFNPHSAYLHKGLVDIKANHNYFEKDKITPRELKYNGIIDPKSLQVAKEAVDLFMRSTSWFRAIVIKLDGFNYDYFGKPNETEKIKKARAYKKFAQMLLDNNVKSTRNGVLLCDQLTRCKGDLFIEKFKELYSEPPKKVFREILEIDSKLEQYHVNQINDILMGSIINHLSLPGNKYKAALREYVIKSIGCYGLTPEHWKKYTKGRVDDIYPKYQIWFWESR